MNYFQKMNDLIKEAVLFKQYRRLNLVLRILAFILMAHFIALSFIFAGIFYVVATIYKFITMPLEFLKMFMHNEKENMHFGVQMIIYLICLPIIFLLEIISAFIMLQVAVIYFLTTIIMYIATLAGITFKPFILDDVKRDFNTDYQDLGKKGLLFIIIAYALLLIIFILFLFSLASNVTLNEPTFEGGSIQEYEDYLAELKEYKEKLEFYGKVPEGTKDSLLSFVIFYCAFIILYPIFMFKLEPKKDVQQIEEPINE